MEPAESYLEEELDRAPRALTSNVFHYTNTDAAVFGILASGALRLSPFSSTNDLWESRPSYYNLSAHADDSDFEVGSKIWDEIDQHIRLNAKVVSLAQDWTLPDTVIDQDALRGWSHLSLWAHYGGAHTGVCLRFDKEKLVESLRSEKEPSVQVFHGPVEYRSASLGVGPHSIDIGQAREFGLDAVAMFHAVEHAKAIFFQKHRDWANESEYRLVRLDQSVLPFAVDIRSSLNGVVLGDLFPDNRLPALMEVLKKYPNVEVLRARFHNRRLWCMPFEASEYPQALHGAAAQLSPRRSGSLMQRVSMLQSAEASVSQLRARGELFARDLRTQMGDAMSRLADQVWTWPEVTVEVHSGIEAVPPRQRSRKAGVSGEQVHYETGLMLVARTITDDAQSLVCSAALQILDGATVRFHAAIVMENLRESPNHRTEQWRAKSDGGADDAASRWKGLLESLSAEVLHIGVKGSAAE